MKNSKEMGMEGEEEISLEWNSKEKEVYREWECRKWSEEKKRMEA